jgi:HEPN domain-containing protein
VRTHDLQYLADQLAERKSPVAAEVQGLAESLAEAYVSGRYPGFDVEDENWPDLLRQLERVEGTLGAVRVNVG